MFKRTNRVLALFTLSLACNDNETELGSIVGKVAVMDNYGELVNGSCTAPDCIDPFVEITLSRLEDKVEVAKTISSADGDYWFDDVSSGSYVLTFSKDGFAAREPELEVFHVGNSVTNAYMPTWAGPCDGERSLVNYMAPVQLHEIHLDSLVIINGDPSPIGVTMKLHGNIIPKSQQPRDGKYVIMVFLGYEPTVSKDSYDAVLPTLLHTGYTYVTEEFDVTTSSEFSYMRISLGYNPAYKYAKAYVNHIDYETWYACSPWGQTYRRNQAPKPSTVLGPGSNTVTIINRSK
jgi:hypothetical protein